MLLYPSLDQWENEYKRERRAILYLISFSSVTYPICHVFLLSPEYDALPLANLCPNEVPPERMLLCIIERGKDDLLIRKKGKRQMKNGKNVQVWDILHTVMEIQQTLS